MRISAAAGGRACHLQYVYRHETGLKNGHQKEEDRKMLDHNHDICGTGRSSSQDDRDLDQEMADACDRLAEVIKAWPEDMRGELCITSFRVLQMEVRPASAPGQSIQEGLA